MLISYRISNLWYIHLSENYFDELEVKVVFLLG